MAETDNIKILLTDKKEMDKMKVHPSQPYWEIVSELMNCYKNGKSAVENDVID
jgi:hypothetical protein